MEYLILYGVLMLNDINLPEYNPVTKCQAGIARIKKALPALKINGKCEIIRGSLPWNLQKNY